MGTRLATSAISLPPFLPLPPDDKKARAEEFVTPRLLFSIIMVECPQSHKIRNKSKKHTHGAPLSSSHNESQRVTNSHKVTSGPKPSTFLGVTQCHKVAPGPNSSAFLESHTASQSSTRSQPDSIPRVTQRHKVPPSPSPSAFWVSRNVTKLQPQSK